MREHDDAPAPAVPAATTAPRTDRRRRHADDPVVQISVNFPVSSLNELDDAVLARGGTRSGAIVIAVKEWLARQESAAR